MPDGHAHSTDSPKNESSLFGVDLKIVALVVIALYGAVAWFGLRPGHIVEDWAGWRQSDTQSIARHLAEPGGSFLYPRINWGGAGPGYVETEMQGYAGLIAMFLRVFGDVEWPGQLLSLASILVAAWALFGTLSRTYHPEGALLGMIAFLAAPCVIYIASSVQPEGLCLALFIIGWGYFLRYEADGETKHLVLYALFGGAAMLVKPTAAQIGVASFLLLVLRSRQRLATKGPWIAWSAMVGALVLFMWHAHGLYVQYGNTFGVLSGGDSKMPKPEHLLMPGTYRLALNTVLVYGFGIAGAAAFGFALVKKQVDPLMWAILAGNVLWTFISLRYVCNIVWGGMHYCIISAVLGAHAVARILEPSRSPPRWLRLAALGALALGLLFATRSRFISNRPILVAQQVSSVGQALAKLTSENDLVVVRSPMYFYDKFWRTPANYQDPRVFYVSRTRGWPLGSDQDDPALLTTAKAKGARFYVDPGNFANPPIDDWLAANAKLVATTEFGGRIFAL